MNNYEDRIVVFMDILGFKNLINSTTTNLQLKNQVFSVMNMIKNIELSNYTGVARLDEIGKEVTVFSDSIAISYPCSLPSALYYILIDIIHIQLELANNGILLRGGISVGELYHKGNIIFGPAMIQAYLLESTVAKTPRIIVENRTLDFAINCLPRINELNYETDAIFRLLKQDSDGYFFINFLEQFDELDYGEDIVIILNCVKNMIVSYLNCGIPDIQIKYDWMKNYYNDVISKIPSLANMLI